MRRLAPPRRLAGAVLALAALTVLPACRYHQQVAVEVDADGRGTFAVRQGLDREAMEVLAQAGFTADDYFAPHVEPEPGEPGRERRYDDGEITGVEYVIPFSTWSEAADLVADALGGGARLGPDAPAGPAGAPAGGDPPERVVFSADLASVAADLEGNLLSATGSDPDHPALAAAGGSVDRRDLAEAVTLEFRLRLPGRVEEHDADAVASDGTLVWKLFPGDAGPARAVAKLGVPGTDGAPGGALRASRIGLAIVVLAVGAVGGARRVSRHRAKRWMHSA